MRGKLQKHNGQLQSSQEYLQPRSGAANIPNMQEPIISEELFDRVQELRSHKRRNTKTGRASLFAGLLFCPDCGAKLHFCAAKSLKPNQEFYRCANYNSGRGTCNIHYIRNVVLEQIRGGSGG